MAPRLSKPPQPIKRGKKGSIKRAVYKAGGGKKTLKVAKSMSAADRAAIKKMSAAQRKTYLDTRLARRKSVGLTVKGKRKKKDQKAAAPAIKKFEAGLARFKGTKSKGKASGVGGAAGKKNAGAGAKAVARSGGTAKAKPKAKKASARMKAQVKAINRKNNPSSKVFPSATRAPRLSGSASSSGRTVKR